ncbi:hypothetical protein A605_13855 [Corynebacterium halotolerans YIM 70093 = DSM 44683]|uniref:Uncharacterized protein n=1 Tax=Corynebacterium halotolerans YIM 70093 = DSM 44683 TaxID=1121362 RepID=M1NWA2_9CORY|nr:hypothetical protein A605_13855 [Corynebacterium halotolerans YIM 70093 = DSM 44683]
MVPAMVAKATRRWLAAFDLVPLPRMVVADGGTDMAGSLMEFMVGWETAVAAKLGGHIRRRGNSNRRV